MNPSVSMFPIDLAVCLAKDAFSTYDKTQLHPPLRSNTLVNFKNNLKLVLKKHKKEGYFGRSQAGGLYLFVKKILKQCKPWKNIGCLYLTGNRKKSIPCKSL